MVKSSKYYGLRGLALNVAIAVVAGTDFALFGYDQGVMGGLLTLKQFLQLFPQIDTEAYDVGTSARNRASNVQGITVGSYTLGCFFGACATIGLGNLLGRKRTIMIGSSIMIVGAIIQCSSYSLGQLIAGRLVTGFGNGMNTSTVPTWQSETSKSHRRGQMVMIEGSLIVFGVMISYWIDLGFSFLGSSVAWRFPIAFQILLALFIVILIPGLPESPRWLVLKGKDQEALEVLSALNDLEEDDVAVQDEFRAVKDTVLEMSKGGFTDCFAFNRNRNFHRTLLGYVSQVFQQISGINIITYYAATIFVSIGLGPFLSRLLAALNGTEYFLASLLAIPTIERFGRRKLMIFGGIGMSASMAILAGTTSQINNKHAGIAAAVFLFVFNTFFALGFLGMTWLYPAEITPLSIRAPANAISTTGNWIFNFLIVMITPVLFARIQYGTYIIFAAINAFIVPCIYFFYPETAYRSLEEMDEIFHEVSGFKGVFTVVKVAREKPRRYGKNGELLIPYEDTEEARRRSSVVKGGHGEDSASNEQKEDGVMAHEKV